MTENVLVEGEPESIANAARVKAVYLGHGDEINDAMAVAGAG